MMLTRIGLKLLQKTFFKLLNKVSHTYFANFKFMLKKSWVYLLDCSPYHLCNTTTSNIAATRRPIQLCCLTNISCKSRRYLMWATCGGSAFSWAGRVEGIWNPIHFSMSVSPCTFDTHHDVYYLSYFSCYAFFPYYIFYTSIYFW
jgi:hypothetical protein